MIDNKRILAIVPARGGSKGVPLKNIRPVMGVPLVAMVGHLIQKIPIIDRAVVSTDHPGIARISSESGLAVPFMRPLKLSGDRIGDWDVLQHALLETEKIDGAVYDIVVMLQPTSPMRRPQHVIDTIEKLVREGWDSVWTVTKSDPRFHPLKQLKIIDGQVEYYDKRGCKIIARQQLDSLYHKDGTAYAMTRECILEQKTIKGIKSGALIIDEEMVSIDNLFDFKIIEFLLSTESEEMKVK